MKKLFLSIKRGFICILLSFSILTTNTAAITYHAAAIPVVYTGWQTLVTIFALLGITICAAPDISEDEAAQELVDAYVGWKVLKGEGQGDSDGDGEDDLYSTFDPVDWLTSDNKLQMSQDDLESWQDFYYDHMAEPSNFKPSDLSVNLYGCSWEDFLAYYEPILSLSSSVSSEKSFLTYAYEDFCAYNYSGVFISYYGVNSSNPSTVLHFLPLRNDSSFEYCMALHESNGIYYFWDGFYSSINSTISHRWYDFGTEKVMKTTDPIYNTGSNDFTVHSLVVNGRVYSFDDVFSYPQNLTTANDLGNIVKVSDFIVPTNNLGSNITDIVNSIGDSDLTDVLQDQSFDVIGGGRDYDKDKQEATGDITVSMPSSDIITAYQEGLITYEQMLDALGVTPIDESTGTNLLTQELLDTNKGIFAGVQKLVDFVGNIWDFLVNGLQSILNGIAEAIQSILAFLNNLIDSLVQALIDMLSSLFVPSDGYFEDYFNRLNNFFEEKLGLLYVPIGLLISVLNALMESEPGSTQIYFPGIQFQEYVLAEPQYVELDLSADFPKLYTYLHLITNIILVGAVICLLQVKLKELIKN